MSFHSRRGGLDTDMAYADINPTTIGSWWPPIYTDITVNVVFI